MNSRGALRRASGALAAWLAAGLMLVPSGARADSIAVDGTLPSARDLASAAAVSNFAAYVFGGRSSGGTVLNGIVRYVPGAGSGTTVSALPTARYGTSAVWDGQNVFVFGGTGAAGALLPGIVRFEPATWTATTVGSLPAGRSLASAIWNGQRAYLLFGLEAGVNPGESGPTDTVVEFDTASQSITREIVLPVAARYGTSAVWTGQEAFVFGGYDGVAAFSDIVRYAPGTASAQVVASLPSARFGTSAVWDGSNAYIFGGRTASGSVLDDIVRFNPGTLEVTVLTPTLPSQRARTSAAWVNDRALIFGGETATPGTYLGDILSYVSDRPPSAPLDTRARPGLGLGRIDLSWQPPASSGSTPVTAYRVFRGTAPGALSLLVQLPAGTLEYADVTGAPLTNYFYAISAVNTLEGLRSNETCSKPFPWLEILGCL